MAKHHQWLRGELENWQREGLIDTDQATSLRTRYAGDETAAGGRLLTMALSVFGALLIGAGIIALVTFNWNQLDRWARAAVAVLPVIISLLLTAWVFWQGRRDSPPWCEGLAAFYVAALGCCLGLIAQTYHVGGELSGLILLWSLVGLPIVYLLRSAFAGCAYLFGITFWLFDHSWGMASLWWVLLALPIIPHIIWRMRHRTEGPGTWLLLFAQGLALFAALIHFLEEMGVDDLNQALCLLFTGCAYTLFTGWLWPEERRKPLLIGGGGVVLFYLLLMNVGETHWLSGFSPNWVEVLVFVVPALLCLALVPINIRRGHWSTLSLLAVPLTMLGTALITGNWSRGDGSEVIANLLGFGIGVVFLIDGASTLRTGLANLGMLLMGAVLALRFFDGDFPLLVKGLVFIGVGVALLLLNFFLSRRRNKPEPVIAA